MNIRLSISPSGQQILRARFQELKTGKARSAGEKEGRRIHPTVAFWTIAIGVTTGVIWIIIGSPFGLEVLWPAGVAGILVMVIGSLLAKPSHYKGVEGLALTENPDRSGSSD